MSILTAKQRTKFSSLWLKSQEVQRAEGLRAPATVALREFMDLSAMGENAQNSSRAEIMIRWTNLMSRTVQSRWTSGSQMECSTWRSEEHTSELQSLTDISY